MASTMQYWREQPPEHSGKADKWLAKFRDGWRPNARIQGLGWEGCVDFYGVTPWEYFNVILPVFDPELAARLEKTE